MAGQARPAPFRLARVLEHRRKLTEEAEHELALRAREHQEAQAALEALRQARRASFDAGAEQSLDLAALATSDVRDLRLRALAARQQQAIAQAATHESAAREQLLERRVSQRALEKLRERHEREQQQRLRAAEERASDEIATIRHSLRAGATPGGRA